MRKLRIITKDSMCLRILIFILNGGEDRHFLYFLSLFGLLEFNLWLNTILQPRIDLNRKWKTQDGTEHKNPNEVQSGFDWIYVPQARRIHYGKQNWLHTGVSLVLGDCTHENCQLSITEQNSLSFLRVSQPENRLHPTSQNVLNVSHMPKRLLFITLNPVNTIWLGSQQFAITEKLTA